MPLSRKLHNQRILDSAKPGDMLKAPRGLYSHYGIYTGDGVVHRTGDGHGIGAALVPESVSSPCGVEINKAEVRKDPFSEFAGDSPVSIKNCSGRLSPRQIVENAHGKIGDRGYNVFSKNCEHFATGCQTGKESSSQVTNFTAGAGTFGVLALGAAAITAGVLVHKKKKKQRQSTQSDKM